MKTLLKPGVVLSALLVSVILVRLILQWVFAHNQGLFSLENFIYPLIFPVILVFTERSATITTLLWKSAVIAAAFTLFDYLLARDADWPAMIW